MIGVALSFQPVAVIHGSEIQVRAVVVYIDSVRTRKKHARRFQNQFKVIV